MLSTRSAILGLTLALTSAGVATATEARYLTSSFTEPASAGSKVTGPLSDFVVVARARVVAPESWRRLPSKAGQQRFETTRSPGCRYRVTFSVSKRLAAAGDAERYVAAGLPAASARYLLDSGVHGRRAFRVVRQKSSSQVRVDGLWAAVLTRRTDIAPRGQVMWSEIHVTARSRAGDECHSGTYRQVLGPQIGDALATATSTLRFVKPTG
ncbi:MAG TPA: hypothetical protein VGO80_23650 [Solirubrobacteraceae bacterium]|jgi:hypothetical protein|nr:hypothetical protein [Solirubrobacteraceae bacterium]